MFCNMCYQKRKYFRKIFLLLSLIAITVSSADNPKALQTIWTQIWIQTIWHSDSVLEEFFQKVYFEKVSRQQQKHEKITQHVKS